MRQLDADLRRFFARRIVRGTVVVILLVAVVSIGIATVRGHPARGVTSAPVGRVVTTPNGNQVIYNQTVFPNDTRISVGKSLHGTLQAMAVIMMLVGIVLGASFVGADFNVGSLTSQLLYEPRRWRVHLAKAACVAIGCAVVAAVVCIAIAAMMYAGSEIHGVVGRTGGTFWRLRGVDLARAIGAAAAAAVMAYAVTVVADRTSAAIVAFLVQFPIIHIGEHTPFFGPIARIAPFRGLLAITTDIHNNTDIGIRTNAGAIVFTLIWVVILLAASGAVFSRAEVR